ncbi:MAG: hypothetical protein ACOVK6_00690 [Ramlibacter sp.]
MTSPAWQRSDGELLKALREQAGLDRVVLARMGTMTVHQLRGLEEGDGGEFYSPEIKAHMGRTLLAKLGHVAPASPASPASPARDAAPGEDAGRSVTAQSGPLTATLTAPVTVSLARERGEASAKSVLATRKSARSGRTAVITLGLVALTVGAWALIGPRPRAPVVAAAVEVPRPVTAVPAETAPAAAVTRAEPAPAAAVAAPASMATVAVPVSAPVATTAASPAPPPAADTACVADPGASAVAYTPSEPRKAGNFVYLVADKPARLCVVDATRKATRVDLDAGGGRSVYGAAPFVVQGDLGHLRIFFQGVRVQGEMGAGTRVVLNEAPVR